MVMALMILQRILTKMARGILWIAEDPRVSKESRGRRAIQGQPGHRDLLEVGSIAADLGKFGFGRLPVAPLGLT
jgi:hypothetical protein